MELIKQCTVCAKDFQAKSDKKEYCSNACRTFAFRKREKQGKSNDSDPGRHDPFHLEQRLHSMETNQQQYLEQFYVFAKEMTQNHEVQGKFYENLSGRKEEKEFIQMLSDKVEQLAQENIEIRNELNKTHFELIDLRRAFELFQSDILSKENQYLGGVSPLESIAQISEKLFSNDLLVEKLAGLIPSGK